ncbi:MAG: dipeptidase [Chlamydiales bacterium]|nr:dipeptidase [Chlamydiales bacterium]
MQTDLNFLRNYFKKNQESILSDFFSFLRFQSISQDASHLPEMGKCLNFLKDYLEKIGFETEKWETHTHPVLFAKWMKAGPEKPTILIYNHYDVQPVDPIEKWETPPFEPSIRNNEVFARGAQDNKGQCFYVLLALKAILENEGSLPVNVKLCIEGDEEIGSEGLKKLAPFKEKELKADHLLIVDVGIKSKESPAITLGTRGILGMLLDLKGSSSDLHSGEHGGIVVNPIHALVDLLAKLHSPSGRVMVPGFYDDVLEPTKEEKSLIDFSFDAAEYEHNFHAKALGGEDNYTPLERAWIRPTLEINGICGGYTGIGLKTIIPAMAHAKITCRLVANQNPDKIGVLVTEFLNEHKPKEMHLHIDTCHGSPAIKTSPHSTIAKAATTAYSEVFETPCKMIMAGGSIGVSETLVKASHAEPIFLGLGLADDQIHAPNEHFGIDRLEKGMLIIARILQTIV